MNRGLWIKAFFGLLLIDEIPELNELDRTNLEDFFTWKTLDLLKSNDKREIEKAVFLMENFDRIATNKGKKGLSRFFYSLAILLRFKHDIKIFPKEKRESFEKSFKKTREKLNKMDLKEIL